MSDRATQAEALARSLMVQATAVYWSGDTDVLDAVAQARGQADFKRYVQAVAPKAAWRVDHSPYGDDRLGRRIVTFSGSTPQENPARAFWRVFVEAAGEPEARRLLADIVRLQVPA